MITTRPDVLKIVLDALGERYPEGKNEDGVSVKDIANLVDSYGVFEKIKKEGISALWDFLYMDISEEEFYELEFENLI